MLYREGEIEDLDEKGLTEIGKREPGDEETTKGEGCDDNKPGKIRM